VTHEIHAPVVLFVYNRPVHTALVIDSLLKNFEAKKTDLIIYSDAPKALCFQAQVQEVRALVSDVKGFKSVRIILRENNLGLSRSIISGVSDVLDEYGVAIVLEDDLVVSPFFLKYMNSGLDLYRDDKKVASIHGYTYPVNDLLPETFFLRGGDCWGWATWSRAWGHFNLDGVLLLSELKERGLTKEFDLDGSYPYIKMLKNQIQGKNDSWAIRWHASLFLKNMLTLYPGRSLVQNIGHDGTGVHSAKTSYLNVTLCNEKVTIGNIKICEDSYARGKFKKFLWNHHSSPFAIIKRIYYKILFYLFP
jgi:hypothetical protein